MKKLFLLLLVGSIYFCPACKQNNTSNDITHIEISPKSVAEEVNLSNFSDSVSYVSLQLGEDDLIGNVQKVYIGNKYIYLEDRILKQILVFDLNGQYISKLAKLGDGPDCYLWITSIFFDPKEEYIEIVDMARRKILKYDLLSFNLISSTDFNPKLNYNACLRSTDNTYYFVTQQLDNIVNESPTNTELVIMKEGKFYNKYFDKKITTNNSYYSIIAETILQNADGKIFYSSMFSNTFHQINDTTLTPLYYFDFGEEAAPRSLEMSSTKEQMKFFREKSHVVLFPTVSLYDENYLFMTYFYKEEKQKRWLNPSDLRQYIWNKKNNQIYNIY